MNPRKIRAWAGRVLLAVGIAVGVLVGTQVAASASDAAATSQDSGASVQLEPDWG